MSETQIKKRKVQINVTVNPEIKESLLNIAKDKDTTLSTEVEIGLDYWLGARNRENELRIKELESRLLEAHNIILDLERQLEKEKATKYRLLFGS
jgi:hypothetical protein